MAADKYRVVICGRIGYEKQRISGAGLHRLYQGPHCEIHEVTCAWVAQEGCPAKATPLPADLFLEEFISAGGR